MQWGRAGESPQKQALQLCGLLHISAAAQAGGTCGVPLCVGGDTLVRDHPGQTP